MSRTGVLARGRAAAEKGMTDACLIRQRTGSATDRDTGVSSPTFITVYSGPCRLQQQAAIARPHDAGQDAVWLVRFDLQLPVTASAGLQVGDVVTITTATNDPDLLGRLFTVNELAHKSEATSRRVGVVEKTGS